MHVNSVLVVLALAINCILSEETATVSTLSTTTTEIIMDEEEGNVH